MVILRQGSLALLLDRPQPVGFLGIWVRLCRLRYQPSALFAEVVEAAPQLAAG
jgi:hypothetical protein